MLSTQSHRRKLILTYKKLSPRRLTAIPGPKAKKPPVRQQNKELAELKAEEAKTLEALVRDAAIRLAFRRGSGEPFDELSIWTDFDLTSLYTELDPRHLKRWLNLSEWMKLQIGFLVGLNLGGAAFTAHIHSDLLDKWVAEGMSVSGLVQRRLKKELDAGGLGHLPYCYVIESRTKWGKSRTAPHLHGIIMTDNPHEKTQFKLAVDRALTSGDRRRQARKVSIRIQHLHNDAGTGRLVSYITKNVHRWDGRIKGRSVFMSRSFTQTARELWALIREEPVA